ncbi:MAG: peptidoglycan-binding protein [Allorhizobium sp.]
MTTRKRKSPEKKPKRPTPGTLSRAAAVVHRLVARHPFAIGGVTAFGVVFGFVSANALWYQPDHHPSPFLRTRDATDLNALAGGRQNARAIPDPDTVTTFRIARAPDDTDTSTTASLGNSAVSAAGAPETDAVDLVAKVQQQLTRRHLYDGAEDGVPGPRTSAAIAVFQKSVGMEPNGAASPELLAALAVDGGARAAMPQQRPPVDLSALNEAEDPVAAAIRNASKPVIVAAKADANTQPAPPSGSDAELVVEIQRGLSNIAYAEVTIDGVAGAQTRAAIRHFEKHYRLPETGEPNEKVLKKLRDIGAL